MDKEEWTHQPDDLRENLARSLKALNAKKVDTCPGIYTVPIGPRLMIPTSELWILGGPWPRSTDSRWRRWH